MSERLFLHLDGDTDFGPETSAPAGTLQAYTPRAALCGQVASILSYREQFSGAGVSERVVPDGVIRLAFNFGDAPAVGGVRSLAAEAIGAAAAPVVVQLQGNVDGLSVALRAGAAAALLGVPAAEIAATAVSLEQLWGRAGRELAERLQMAAPEQRVDLLQDALQQRLAHSRGDEALAAQAARLVAASGGNRRLSAIAAELGIGERRLQQLFQAQVGLSPRSYGRLARLHFCLRRLREETAPDWAALALDCGFYDQSHLVNEFRALCGVTPVDYLGRAIAGSSNTPG